MSDWVLESGWSDDSMAYDNRDAYDGVAVASCSSEGVMSAADPRNPRFVQRENMYDVRRMESHSDAMSRSVNWGGYRAWPPHSSIKLMSVPWGSNYRDVIEFADKQARDAWFDGKNGVTVENMSMLNYGQPVSIDKPYGEVMQYNYCRIVNPYSFVEGDSSKKPTSYYYFIINAELVNPSCTRITLQLDVWTTYYYDIAFGRAYVRRGHIGIANENQWESNGRKYLDIPEGLDTGSDYRINNYYWDNTYYGIDGIKRDFVVVSTTDLLSDPGTVSDPKLATSQGFTMSGIPSGATTYVLEADGSTDIARKFWDALSDYPWIAQGIISMYAIDRRTWKRLVDENNTGSAWLFGKSSSGVRLHTTIKGHTKINDYYRMGEYSVTEYFPERYRNLSKFLTYPYMWFQASMSTGENMCIKPQYINTPTGRLVVDRWDWIGSPNPCTYYVVRNYGGARFSDDAGYTGGAHVGASIHADGALQVLTVSDTSTMFAAQNAHSLQNAVEGAQWAQDKARLSARNAWNNSVASSGLALRQNDRAAVYNMEATALGNSMRDQMYTLNVDRSWANYALNDVPNAIGQTVGGNVAGAIGGVVGGALSNAASNYFADRERSIANSNATAATVSANDLSQTNAADSNRVSRGIADANKALAMQTAAGDYAQSINQVNAKIQDSKLSAPNQLGAMGGEIALTALGEYKFWIRTMLLGTASMYNIGETWLRYGYMVQRFMRMPERLCCMTRFAYWQCDDVTLSEASRVPEELRMALRGILEQGVTVWQRPEDIANIDIADNDPYSGYSY